MIFRAGFALNIVGSFVNGLMPFRAFVAGFLTTTNLTNPGTERLDDAPDVRPRNIVRMMLRDFLNELRLRHQLGHVSSLYSESSCDYVSLKFAESEGSMTYFAVE